MRTLIKNSIFILFFTLRNGLAATVDKPGENIINAASPLSFSYVAQILISFLVVVAFIFLMAWIMRRTGRLGGGNSQLIKIVSSMSLGMREKILLIEVGKENILIGVAPGQIRTLHVIQDGSELKDGVPTQNAMSNKGFKQLVERFSKQ